MNFTLEEALAFVSNLQIDEKLCNVLLAPPTVFLALLSKKFPSIKFCAQDVSKYNKFGSQTGECSSDMVKSCGVNFAIVGHSERRENFRETNRTVKRKASHCIESGIVPIICFGESIEARKAKHFKDFIIEQINESTPEINGEYILAYEPCWAIGSGITPTREEILEVIDLIKTSKKLSTVAKNSKLVYGGSVNVGNYQNILALPGISGLLIGSTSLKFDEFQKIIFSV